MFKKEINIESRDEMVDFLRNHFRYFTMNSWNVRSSYANNMKNYNLYLPSETEDKLYDLLDIEDVQSQFDILLDDFAAAHGYEWQAGWNGRSGGYLVLYSGGRKKLDYKLRCTSCGPLNYKAAEEGGCRCGRCRKNTRVNLASPVYQAYINSASIDDDEDFWDWDLYELQKRVQVVMDFDRLCDDIVTEAVYMAEQCEVVEETYYVEKARKVLVECESA